MPDGRLALCLSGGGFRAALFHLGALRRINELGVVSKISTVSSVSGGSILAAHLAKSVHPWPAANAVFPNWEETVEAPFLHFIKTNIRTWPVLKRFLIPWNWFRPGTQAQTLETTYRSKLTDQVLMNLPDHPKFVFCATDIVFGVSWVFEKERVGSYQAGYVKPTANWPVARAVAASSCFPPVFSPLPIALEPGQKPTGGKGGLPNWDEISVSDGGLYDNLGLQPVEKHEALLVSDGGLPFFPSYPMGVFGRLKAYLSIQGKQAGSVRKRSLIAQYEDKKKAGTYWGIGSAVTSYHEDASPGYSKAFATNMLAMIRTDMDAFSDAEIAVLMNHGYLLADVAVKKHAESLIAQDTDKRVPFPGWMDEEKAGEALKNSSKRNWWGRS